MKAACYSLFEHYKGRTRIGAIMLRPCWPETVLLVGSVLPYLIPFGVALAAAGVLRLVTGPDRGAHIAGISILIGFAAAWNWLLLMPWIPYDTLSRVVHIAIGGFMAGLALDLMQLRRTWAVAIIIVFALGCVWATISGALLGAPPDEAGGWLRFGLYILVWLGLFARLNTLKQEGPTALVTVLMLAMGLGLIGQMSGEGAIAAAAYCLAAALTGYLVLVWALALAIGDAVVLGGGGAVLGLAMALAEPDSTASAVALLFLLLVLFADGTAKRLPLGPSALRPALYPLALIGVAILPVSMAAIISFLLVER